jgi:hypothetical protein
VERRFHQNRDALTRRSRRQTQDPFAAVKTAHSGAVSMMQKQHTPWNNRIATARLILININYAAFM